MLTHKWHAVQVEVKCAMLFEPGGETGLVTRTGMVVGLLSNSKRTRDVLEEVYRVGGQILSLGDEGDLPAVGDSVAFMPGLGEIAGSMRYLPALHLMALARATAKGLNPDKPRNLTAVVELKNNPPDS